VSRDTTDSELLRWLRADMQAGRGEQLGAGYQAIVHRHRGPFGDIVVKSPHEKSLFGLIGRGAVQREHRVYARLAGVPGVPRLLGLLDDTHLVLEYVDGPALRAYDKKIVDRERFFSALLESIEAMHAAGVAHGDLKRKDNIVVGPNGRPYIIDFGIARLRNSEPNGRSGFVFEWVKQMDYNAWAKLKYRRRMSELSPEDATRYKPLMLERVARWIRIPWQTLTLRRPRQRWRARRKP
jgi:predicted Ser/Thr protein kinase